MKAQQLFLFDVDSVLVAANGYLRALQDTVAHFSRRMGVGPHPPTESEVRAGEAHGLTSEWDSTLAYIVALLIERLRLSPDLVPPARWPAVLDFLAARPLALAHPDYAALVVRVGEQLQAVGGITSAAVLVVLQADVQALPPAQQDALHPVLETLFAHTHAYAHAPIMRHFQHLAIGSDNILSTYKVAAQFTSSAYLQAYDVAFLSAERRTQVLDAIAAGQVSAVVYTARPSLPPSDVDASPLGYSPEAEMARTLLGLDTLPLIGWGRLCWLAQQTGADAATLVKPSPVQALAAIGAATGCAESVALQAAWALYQKQELASPLADLGEVAVHVFEDSPGGLRAVQRAVELLNAAGVQAHYYPYGITPEVGAKATAMAEMGVTVYPSVNEALGVALQ